MQFRHTLAGVVALAAIAILTAGCSSGSDVTSGSGGAVRVVLSGSGSVAPAGLETITGPESVTSTTGGAFDRSITQDHDDHGRKIRGVSIELTDVQARSATEGKLVQLDLDLPRSLDLVQLAQNGGEIELGVGQLPADMYDQMVFVISSMTLTARDGTMITITPPGGGWTRIIAVRPFEVVEGQTTTIQITMKPKFFFKMDDRIDDIRHDDFDCDWDVDVDDD